MTAWPRMQIVTAPRDDATVIFDANAVDGTLSRAHLLQDGWTLGVPERLAATGDESTAWGHRSPEFRVALTGARAWAMEQQSIVSRWLLGPSGWVRFQLDEISDPVWLRMRGAGPRDITAARARPLSEGASDVWLLPVAFDADPFLIGPEETLHDAPVSNDPIAPGGMIAPLSPVRGDAPARLRVRVSATASPPNAFLPFIGRQWRVSSLPRWASQPSGVKVFDFGVEDGFTSDLEAVVDLRAVGWSSRRLEASHTNMAVRISDLDVSDVHPGVYRALLRVNRYESPTGIASAEFRVSQQTTESAWLPRSTSTLAVTLPVGSGGWLDLGDIALPVSLPEMDWDAYDAPESSSIAVSARHTASSGPPVGIDALVLVPVRPLHCPGEVRTALTELSTGFSGISDDEVEVMWDGVNESVLSRREGGAMDTLVEHLGGWPTAYPGATNDLHLTRHVLSAPGGTLQGMDNPRSEAWNEVHVNVTYRPQWLHMPGSGDA